MFKEVMNDMWLAKISSLSNEVTDTDKYEQMKKTGNKKNVEIKEEKTE